MPRYAAERSFLTMHYMGLNEIREKYLSFFESKGHLRLPSFPLIPQNDKSILLINAGMTPMKPYFTGQETPPRNRVTTCQKCIRTPDIDCVGKDARHGTFFEMLGNFSFGDYFKREAITWAWEFCTKVMEMPVDKLYVTVYLEDDEAYDIWTKEVGVDPSHVSRMGKEDNFWEHGSGPCGPCSEIYFDRGADKGCGRPDCHVGCDCDRYVEFWNVVFSQFNNDGHNNYTPLEKKNIDTGMGLERLACIMQDVDSLFDVDTIKNITAKISEMSAVKYGENHLADVSLRVITDHIRSTTFMVCDGVLPSNEGRGYVLRRLLRRAARHGRLLGIKEPHFLAELAEVVIHESESAYPELREKAAYIKKVIEQEEDRFEKTIDQGLAILGDIIKRVKDVAGKILDGEETFRLYDTFGFPIDLTREIAAENGLETDEKRFLELMAEQKKTARSAAKGFAASAWKDNEALAAIEKTEFSGYTKLVDTAKVLAILKDDEAVGVAEQGDDVTVVLDRTPFYAESGGQVGDKGVLTAGETSLLVRDTKKANGIYLHECSVAFGSLTVGDEVKACVNKSERLATMRNHSAVHLLQAALRDVLGDHVTQAGSYVDAKRARFDFTHFEAMTEEELATVERLVNEYILSLTEIDTLELPIAEAKKLGALALFGEKYGEIVRVVRMGDISTEFCGGTHAKNTAEIGLFKIVSETGVAAGVRRIEAVTGLNVLEYLNEKQQTVSGVASVLKASESELVHKAESVVAQNKALAKEVEALNNKLSFAKLEGVVKSAEEINGNLVMVARIDASTDALRAMCDALRDKYANGVALLAGVSDGKVAIAAGVGKDAVAAGVRAGDLVKVAAKICGGGGGGRPDSATAGGRDASKLGEALAAVKETLKA